MSRRYSVINTKNPILRARDEGRKAAEEYWDTGTLPPPTVHEVLERFAWQRGYDGRIAELQAESRIKEPIGC